MFEFLKRRKKSNETKERKEILSIEEELSIRTSEIEDLLFRAKDFEGIIDFQKEFNNIIANYQKLLSQDEFTCNTDKSLLVKRAAAEFFTDLNIFIDQLKKKVMAFIIKKDIDNLKHQVSINKKRNKYDIYDSIKSYNAIRKQIENSLMYLSYKDKGEISYLMAGILFSLIECEYKTLNQVTEVVNHSQLEEQLLKDYTSDVIRNSVFDEKKVNSFLQLIESNSKVRINEFINQVIIPYINYTIQQVDKSTDDKKARETTDDLGAVILTNSFPKKKFIKENKEIEDYGLLKILNSKKECPSGSLTLEQIYKVIKLKNLQYENIEKAFIRAFTNCGNIDCAYIREIKENYLKLRVKFKEEEEWEEFEVQTYKDQIAASGNFLLDSKVTNMLINVKAELFQVLSFYQFYDESLTLSINGDDINLSINRFGVKIFYDDSEFCVSPLGSPFVINKIVSSNDIHYEIKSLAELTLAKQYGEELFKKIYIKIKELPEWIQQELINLKNSTNTIDGELQNVKRLVK